MVIRTAFERSVAGARRSAWAVHRAEERHRRMAVRRKSAAENESRTSEDGTKKPSANKARVSGIHAHPDSGLRKAEVEKLYQKLVEERDRVDARIRKRIGYATEDASPLVEEGDLAQRATEQDYQLRLADKQNKLLDQVLHAIAKMKTGEYGICEGSGEPIGFRRLEIRPWARYSVEYKEDLDRRNR
ncbi:MAG: TraR/DksA family transcriptional regulator [Myxococcota bacterium]